MNPSLPRREFVHRAGAAAGVLGLLGSAACREAGQEAARAVRDGEPPTTLTPEEVRTLEAAADTILPPDGDAPGAAGLGAVVFMDRFVARDEGTREGLRAALGVLSEEAGGDFAALDDAERAAAMTRFEAHPSGLFGLVHFLTVAGSFGAPARGGNRDEGGWDLLGFRAHGAWQPPFGAYDAPAADRS